MEETNAAIENEQSIEKLIDYISHIYGMLEEIKNNEGSINKNQSFFFRGQSNKAWPITPSVYREKLLPNEAELISAAFIRNPHDFQSMGSRFECLTKLQHYGLPTRLLDVTTNPLVALYFACQKHEEAIKDPETGAVLSYYETDGIVFYKRAYVRDVQERDVQTVCYMATRPFQGDMSLEQCLIELIEQGIYSSEAAAKCRERQYISLISALQSNYFVSSSLNNERLIRQSGAFILPGQFNVIPNVEEQNKSIIQRAIGSLNHEFEEACFIIPHDKKQSILEELDFYNVNEASLFPELEHQMAYVKQLHNNSDGQQIGTFSKIETQSVLDPIQMTNLHISDTFDLEAFFASVINKYVDDPKLQDQCLLSLINHASVDWYLREQVQSAMRLNLTKLLMAPEGKINTNLSTMARTKAKIIVDELLRTIHALSEG